MLARLAAVLAVAALSVGFSLSSASASEAGAKPPSFKVNATCVGCW